MRHRSVVTSCAVALMLMLGASVTSAAARGGSLSQRSADDNRYQLTRLVSDKPGVAAQVDPNLVNAWGLVAGPATPWWVANNGTDTSTLYDGAGTPLSLIVNVADAPTGTVFNGGLGFVVRHRGESAPSLFLFATEGGTIRGWNPAVPPPAPSTKAFRVVDMSGDDAIFKGLAIASTTHGDRLYATDFHNDRVDVFNQRFKPVTIARGVRGSEYPERLRALRYPGDRRWHRRHLREAGRRRRGRCGGSGLRVRGHVQHARRAARPHRDARACSTHRGVSRWRPTASASSAETC